MFSVTLQALLFSIAAVGISETAYLLRTRWEGRKPVCPAGEHCLLVLQSTWSHLLGVPNEVPGFLFYCVLALIAAFVVIGVEPLALWTTIRNILILFGALFSLFLTYLQWRVIRAWCSWCLLSALTTWLMALLVAVSP